MSWNGDDILNRLQAEVAKRLLLAATFLQSEYRKRVNIPNTGTRRKRTRDTAAGKKGSSYTTYDNPSRPGEYPRKITGAGQQGTAFEPASIAAIVAGGVEVLVGHRKNVEYMAFLAQHFARKSIIDAATEVRGQLKAIIAGTQ